MTPADLGVRLVLWLDAGRSGASVNGTKVGVWPDRSSSNNDARQSEDSRQPVYVASGVHGLPALRFDGQSTFLRIADATSLQWGLSPFAVFAVVRGAPALGVNAMIYQKSDADPPFLGPALLVNAAKPTASAKASIQLHAGLYSNSILGVADTTPRLLVGRRYVTDVQTLVELRVNGNVVGTSVETAPVSVDAPGRDAIIGHNGYQPSPGFQAYEGDIAEICAVKGALTDDELWAMEAYLQTKYGL
jgi:hypothetical protein